MGENDLNNIAEMQATSRWRWLWFQLLSVQLFMAQQLHTTK